MAISNTSGSYLSTMEEFITHWTAVNAVLSPTPLVLPGAYDIAALTADRVALETAILNIETANNALQNAATDRDIKRDGLRIRLTQFRALVTGQIGDSLYARSLPTLPPIDADPTITVRAYQDMQTLWTQINADPPSGFTGPLKLPGNYGITLFTTAVTALRTAYTTHDARREEADLKRGARDIMLPGIRKRLQQYRKAVIGTVPDGNSVLLSIPAYSPPPGSTPSAVSLAGHWDGAELKASLTWAASDNPNLDHYSVRYHPGPTYKAAEEQNVASVAAGTTELLTDYGLPASGSTAWYKVYVVLTTDNEKGSNAVKVVRP